MTNIRVWAPHRYNFDRFEEVLLANPAFQNGQVLRVSLNYWPKSPTAYDVCNVLKTALNARSLRNLNIFVFDDDDLEDGCGRVTLETTVRHFINVTRLHPETYFLFADFVDYLYHDGECSPEELTRFKESVKFQCRLQPRRVAYMNFHGLIDGADCDRYNHLTVAGMNKVFDFLIEFFLNELPPGAFQ